MSSQRKQIPFPFWEDISVWFITNVCILTVFFLCVVTRQKFGEPYHHIIVSKQKMDSKDLCGSEENAQQTNWNWPTGVTVCSFQTTLMFYLFWLIEWPKALETTEWKHSRAQARAQHATIFIFPAAMYRYLESMWLLWLPSCLPFFQVKTTLTVRIPVLIIVVNS